MKASDTIEGRTSDAQELPKILLVDDYEPNLMALYEVMRGDKVDVLCAKSGRDALELVLRHDDIALAVIDVEMPEMDGFELVELMRSVQRAKHVPIIFVTAGLRDPHRRFRGYEAGGVDFLYKPIETEVLKSKTKVFLTLEEQRRDMVRLLQALRDSEARLHELTAELEQRVDERTAVLVQTQDQLRTLATELNLAELRERKRLAMELHDHLQQLLVLGRMQIGQVKRQAVGDQACAEVMTKIDQILSEALTYTRTLVTELSPPVLRDHGLAAGLRWLAEYMKKHDQVVSVTVIGDRDINLPEDKVVLLFQSVRELLINSSKHAQTRQATVVMDHIDGYLRIVVRDQGMGFDSAAVAAGLYHDSISPKFGLFSIVERMKALGGSFDIQSSPGKGTTAMLMLPLPKGIEIEVSKPEWTDAEHVNLPTHPFNTRKWERKKMVSVLLVDDHAIIRQGLRSLLQDYEDITVVGEASSAEEAILAVEQLRPQLVVMDINMPKMNGIDATAKIKTRHPDILVIGLSVNADGENQTAMKQAGAHLLLTKEGAVESLYRSIREAVDCHDP